MNQTEQQEYLDQCEAAFLVFAERFPDFDQSESSARLMAAGLREAGLYPTSSDHLAAVWLKIRPSTPAPEPFAKTEDKLTSAARALIAYVGGDAAFSQLVDNLSAKEIERRMRDFVFQKAIELVSPTEAPSILTRGDLVRGANVVRTAERTGSDIAAAHAAVAASRELVASASTVPSVHFANCHLRPIHAS